MATTAAAAADVLGSSALGATTTTTSLVTRIAAAAALAAAALAAAALAAAALAATDPTTGGLRGGAHVFGSAATECGGWWIDSGPFLMDDGNEPTRPKLCCARTRMGVGPWALGLSAGSEASLSSTSSPPTVASSCSSGSR